MKVLPSQCSVSWRIGLTTHSLKNRLMLESVSVHQKQDNVSVTQSHYSGDICAVERSRHSSLFSPVLKRVIRDVALQPMQYEVAPPEETEASPLTYESAYLNTINTQLNAWVDWSKAASYRNQPIQLLQAVFSRAQQTIPHAFFRAFDFSLLADERFFDEAALVYYRLDQHAQNLPLEAPLPSREHLHHVFLNAVRADSEKQSILRSFFAPPALADEKNNVYFDGFALRNAFGKSFDELMVLPQWIALPGFQALSATEKQQRVREKFMHMGEDTHYRIGTVEHSLASTVIRILRYQNQVIPASLLEREPLIEQFQQLETTWSTQRNYPLHPRLLFALHLAHESGVEIKDTDWREQLWQHTMLPLLRTKQVEDLLPITVDLEGEKNKAQLIVLFDELKQKSLSSPLRSFRTHITSKMLRENRLSRAAADVLVQCGLRREVLDGADWKAKAQALLEYASERLLAVYGKAPSFERREVASQMLQHYGVRPEYLHTGRYYTITTDNINLAQTKFGSLVDEFLERADWTGRLGKTMRINGHTVVPQQILQQKEDEFNQQLPGHRWVHAKAKENLRLAHYSLTPSLIQGELTHNVVPQLRTQTENARHWMQGLETWLNTIPLIGSAYNIEEGLRHKDPAQAVLGVVFLGLDALDLLAGRGEIRQTGEWDVAGDRVARVSTENQVTVSTIHHARTVLDFGEMMELERITVDSDPFNLAIMDANVPVEHRVLATRVRNGEPNVKWGTYDVVHLRNEDRVVPVESSGGTYHEIDWYTGYRVPHAKLIQRDTATLTYHSVLGLNGGVFRKKIETQVRGFNVVDRLTSQQVVPLLQRATDVTIRDAVDIFRRRFAIESAPGGSHFDAREFYRALYGDSPTFRRLVNGYDSTAPATERWHLYSGDESIAPGHAKAFTHFDEHRIYIASDPSVERMPFMGVDGAHASSREQVYLHEMLHALTGGRDPSRQFDLLNRGPIVYLTDKILSEAGYAKAQQVMYRRQNALPDLPAHLTVEGNRHPAALAMEAENHYLDGIVDALSMTAGSTRVLGTALEQRVTVTEVKEVMQSINLAFKRSDVTRFFNFSTQFSRKFVMGSVGPSQPDRAAHALRICERLYQRSVLFRRLLNRTVEVAPRSAAERWEIVWKRETGSPEHTRVDKVAKKIYIRDDPTEYLTAQGLKPVEFERQLAEQIVCVLTGKEFLSGEAAYLNRGAVVYLADALLNEAGYHFPKRLAAVTATRNAASRERIVSYQTPLRRAMGVEDFYLNKTN